MKECPNCHSPEIEPYDMALQTKNGESVKYFSTDEPEQYLCKKCDFKWPIKK